MPCGARSDEWTRADGTRVECSRRPGHKGMHRGIRNGGMDVSAVEWPPKMVVLARPRDSATRAHGRIYESYRAEGEWVVEGFDDSGKWLWTHYGASPLDRSYAESLARTWCVPRSMGANGGRAAAASMSSEARSQRARKAVQARWAKRRPVDQ